MLSGKWPLVVSAIITIAILVLSSTSVLLPMSGSSLALSASSLSDLSLQISADPSSGPGPLEVHFYSDANGGRPPYAFSWNFGDGQISANQNPIHVYSNPGRYVATLAVGDASSHSEREMKSVMIKVEKKAEVPLQVSFSANQTVGRAPLSVSFFSSVSGGTPPYQYHWDFGTGETSTDPNPSYVFRFPGAMQVSLTISDGESRHSQANYELKILVEEELPIPDDSSFSAVISGSSDKGGTPLTVQFNSAVQGGIPNYSFLWSFGDGGASKEANPSYTFTQPGQYYVHLTVSDSNSSTISSNTLIISVESPATTAGKAGEGGNPAGALLFLSISGIVALATILIQVVGKRRIFKGKGA